MCVCVCVCVFTIRYFWTMRTQLLEHFMFTNFAQNIVVLCMLRCSQFVVVWAFLKFVYKMIRKFVIFTAPILVSWIFKQDLEGISKISTQNLFHCHFVYQNSCVNWVWVDHGPHCVARNLIAFFIACRMIFLLFMDKLQIYQAIQTIFGYVTWCDAEVILFAFVSRPLPGTFRILYNMKQPVQSYYNAV
jgi:hypothetical protein